ncbi:hypothetical protein MPNT_10069 [Candidatus Methylacidithermus pantelleriae]|uniref:Uncharacterized protein n=1 Tax=Candidatus Methylacidithermus pantelleriae TaxID=2744239 RepID=A0A8J2BFH6_9BACT|nr:hypothetical protein MPNT_10069 [Candidatus Methylacidithermus pantelleriae]
MCLLEVIGKGKREEKGAKEHLFFGIFRSRHRKGAKGVSPYWRDAGRVIGKTLWRRQNRRRLVVS